MIDIKLLRNEYESVSKNIAKREKEYPALIQFKEIDKKWREISTKLQDLNTRRNILTEEITILFKNKETQKADEKKAEVIKLKEEIETTNEECNKVEKELKLTLFSIPNLLDESVPGGADESNNVEIRKFLEPTKFNFTPLPHWELGENLDIIDFERAIKTSGTRSYTMKGDGARLMRALRNYTLDLHISNGYCEILPPLLLNEEVLYGLGKIPFFEEDMYKTNDGQFLSATEEFPITAMYSNEIIDINKLPLKLTGASTSWRREAGKAGVDSRGILRVHQFSNTELINICKEEESWDLLEEMTKQAEKVLINLQIPYRVMTLCAGDTGAAAAKTYDIEVWTPSNNIYREISSCSNCLDYQARGLAIKYRDNKENITKFAHTLNGTGTSLNRLWIAIVENFQQEDGSILIPKELRKYMNNQEYIKI